MSQPEPRKNIFADIGNRAGAMLLDLILVTIAVSNLTALGFHGSIAFLGIAFVYFWGMPLSPLQGTLGKWVCRIKICDRLGRRLGWRKAGARATALLFWGAAGAFFIQTDAAGTMPYAVSLVFWPVFFLPFALMGFLPRGESLFDVLAGTLVVRYSADADSIAQAEPVRKLGIINVSVSVLLCFASGFALVIILNAQRDMERRARVSYAILQVLPLREKAEAFYRSEKHWPSAGALAVAEWTPYPAGGGYRLHADGSIVINFSVAPGLKGHSLTFRPIPVDNDKITWECKSDAGFAPSYLPPNCR